MTCHKSPCSLRPCSQDGKPAGFVCLPCGRVEPAEGIAETPPDQRRSTPQNPRPMPPGDTESARTNKRGKYPAETEAGLVRSIVEALQLNRYFVLRVGQWRADKAGSDAGVPDLLVWSPGRGAFIGVEVKLETGKLSDAQNRLWHMGMIEIARSPDDALKIMRERG